MLEQIGIPAQEAEDAIAKARERNESVDTVDVPNLQIVVVMEAGSSPTLVVNWMEDQNLVHDHTRGRGWLNRWHDGVTGIYVIHTYDPGQLFGGSVYAVVPAHLTIPVRKIEGVSHLMDGGNRLPRP